MADFAEVQDVGGTDTIVNVAVANVIGDLPDASPGYWSDLTGKEGGIGWETVDGGTTFTNPDAGPTTRYLLTWAEWVETHTDDEWDWVDTERNTLPRSAATKALHRMLSKLKEANEINVEVGSYMDPYYTWLVTNGLPGGQTRVDEMREGITSGV